MKLRQILAASVIWVGCVGAGPAGATTATYFTIDGNLAPVAPVETLDADRMSIVGWPLMHHQVRGPAQGWSGVAEVTTVPEPSGMSLLGMTALTGMIFMPRSRRTKK